ncbi:MAG TPA: class I SAM-dependent methyltransferase [Acidimicrobiia bacterium]|jgi:SAM-dependent methyltransferase|nr:class I SAM-dependent methyltransferase [Acidimicrobiia bacterium]
MAETHFDEWAARHYNRLWPHLLDPDILDAAVEALADLAGAGPALELGAGTGRITLPLSARGIRVDGIELSQPMVDVLRAQPGGDDVAVTIGDFATTRVDGPFTLVYLVRNTITNLTTQDEQVACFRNAAAHLAPGGRFVIENYVPELRRLPPGETTYVFDHTDEHLGYEEYDFDRQIAISHHAWTIDGELRQFSSPHRYVWPAELDLMAQLAGLTLEARWSDWHRAPFTGESRSHVSVWRTAAAG